MYELTIGMATYNDYEGVYFTIQALRMYQDMDNVEILVIDNYGCEATRKFVEEWAKGRYVLYKDVEGSAAAKDRVFAEAKGNAVLCIDCHVLLYPGFIKTLKEFYRQNPDSKDLIQGPLLYDDLKSISTHFDDTHWGSLMWGKWAYDERGENVDNAPFEIPMHGLGMFSSLKKSWLGFNPAFRGFGGEEGYLHEKYRQNDGKCLCIPALRWGHRFNYGKPVEYNINLDDRLRNYVIGFQELNLDLSPCIEHFSKFTSIENIKRVIQEFY